MKVNFTKAQSYESRMLAVNSTCLKSTREVAVVATLSQATMNFFSFSDTHQLKALKTENKIKTRIRPWV